MTDNRTTELREKLDALGIKHFDYDKGGRTQTQWEAPDGKRHFTYETSNNPAKTARLVIAWHPTPEQAIAATLDNEVGWRSVALGLFDSLEKADLEAAQKWIVDNDLLRGELAYGDAIAATLGKTCKNEWAEFGKFRCSECWTQVDAISTNTTQPMPIRYCPNCGAKVVNQ